MKSHDQNTSVLIVFLKHFSHVTNLVFVIAFLILISNVNAQKETLPSPSSKSDGFSFDPKRRVNPSVAIIFVCLISAFFIMGCVSVSIRLCSDHRLDAFPDDHTTGSRRRSHRALARGLDSIIIDTFPMFLYSDVKGLKLGKGDLECAVCLNEFEDDETLRLLPKCSHVFHPECIDAWLVSHITCPVCRANLNEPEQETHEPATEVSNSGSEQELNNSTSRTDNVVIDIRIRSPELIVSGKFSPSHSSSHSVVQPGEDCERFTLRLPEDVKNRLIKSELSRAKSCVAFTRMKSSTKGFRRTNSGGGRRANSMDYERFNHSNRSGEWSFMSNPPFFSRDGLTEVAVDGEEPTANPKNLLSSAKNNLKAPFERFFGGAEKNGDGERSFTKLRPDKNPI